jgi:predicted dehydrogenase
MASRVGVALVGAGNIAQSIHLPTLSKMQGVTIAAIVDRHIAKARILAEKYKIPVACRSLDEALALPEVDALIITSSTDAHAEHALAAIAAGKHVFIERPAARTLEETLAIRAALAGTDLNVMIGMNHRFRPDVVQLKNAVDRDEIGEVFYIKAGWVKQRSNDARWMGTADKAGGGVLMDLGVSVVDLILSTFNFGRVHSVVCNTYNQQTRNVEDIVIAMVMFENGSVATIEVSWSLMREDDLFYCNVFGKRGSAYINPFKLVKRVGSSFQTTTSRITKSHLDVYRKSYEDELRHYLSGVRGITPVVSTIDDAVERMKVIEAMYASAEMKREIVIPS